MKLLLIGNGFDLYHKFPTKYENFLHVVNFLIDNYTDSINTVGEVLGDGRLSSIDKLISESYALYNVGYDAQELDKDIVIDLIDKAKNNLWFSYLSKAFNKDLGWIDFEKEIQTVLNVFKCFFEKETKFFQLDTKEWTAEQKFILKHFNFFYNKTEHQTIVLGNIGHGEKVSNTYLIEKPFGSGNYIVDKEKIIGKLNEELVILSEILKLYLTYFVDKSIEQIREKCSISKIKWLNKEIDCVFTLNYTKTYEKLYKFDRICHIHGDIDSDIVLGVNANKEDELNDLNTDFLRFKKYYQRVFYKTDYNYENIILEQAIFDDDEKNLQLAVIGHSLDITDKDIIEELFDMSRKISIYYYKENDITKYIKNLLAIYGKTKFDELRITKDLNFIKLE